MGSNGENTRRDGVPSADVAARPQTGRKHPDEWAADLNPDHMQGQNLGAESAAEERRAGTAHEVKDVHRSLGEDMSDDELKQIPVLAEGQRLQQGGVYIDLNDPSRREFTATGDMSARAGNRYVSKADVPYMLWNRLLGVANGARTHQERRRAS